MNRFDWLVLIDMGHGVETPGKCSPSALQGHLSDPLWFREYQWCRIVGLMVADLLYFQGVDVTLLQTDDHDTPLKQRTDLVNKLSQNHGPVSTLLLSIHNNAAGDGSKWLNARGWSVYTSPGLTASDELATHLFNVAKEEFFDPSRDYYKTFNLNGKQTPVRSDWSDGDPDYEASFWMLTKSICPAVLVENFFQDNKEDVLFLNSSSGKASCAHVMSEGILRYIDSKV